MGKLRIGVLSYQGSVIEHLKAINSLGNATGVEVKTLEALNSVDGLIIPGGESTTIGKLLDIFGLKEPLKKRIEDGMCVWGTCAGLILLAKNIVGEKPYLNVMDITVRRNAYGRQIDSFNTNQVIEEFSDKPIPLIFIRAPWIESVGSGVKVLCSLDGHIVAGREKNMLVTSFHPELSDDNTVHKYFADMIEQQLKEKA